MTEDKQNGASSSTTDDQEALTKKLPYPKSIPFIIGNEFCERFNYYGMRTILVVYLYQNLDYPRDTATVIFHVFTMMVYLCCVFGAFIADSWLGKFRTILYLSMVYVVGSVVISLGAIPPLNLPAVAMTIVGLVLIAFGSGGIKPCVASFGGDQFKLPEQIKQMTTFFSLFYFAINSGSLISTTVTPILKDDVSCFENTDCFSLAFGVPAALMLVSIVIFFLGRPLYVSKPPEGNTFLLVIKAIGNGISNKFKHSKTDPQPHFLDYAIPKYGRQLTSDIKVLLRVLVLYIPIPIFWALFDQQGSRWTLQATLMDGRIGALDLKPEQMQLLNPLLILIFIPLYDVAFYPLLAKIGISRPLQKLTIGGILAGISFVLSGLVELSIEPTHGIVPSDGFSQLRIFNGVPGCNFNVKTNIPDHAEFNIKYLSSFEELYVDVSKETTFDLSLSSSDTGCGSFTGKLNMKNEEAISFFIHNRNGPIDVLHYEDDPEKPEKGNPVLRVLANLKTEKKIRIQDASGSQTVRHDSVSTNHTGPTLPASTFDLFIGDKQYLTFEGRAGDIFALLIVEKGPSQYDHAFIRISPENSVSMLWQIPQYFVMTLGEVMFSVTGLEFSYAQAPLSMKAVLQACWQLTIAIGNLVVVIIAEVKIFDSQAYEFFLFAGLMFVDMVLFMFLAYRYIPNDPNKKTEEDEPEPIEPAGSKKEGVLNPTFVQD